MKSTDAVTPRERQRARTTREILDAAIEQMTSDGIAALNLTDVAGRVGLAQPSLYRYFGSKNAVYDALFARGMTMHRDLLRAVTTAASPGWPAVVAAVRATVEFTDQNPTLARLMFDRTVPGFTPSAEAYAPSVEAMHILHDAVALAVDTGDLAPGAATDAGMELLLTLVAGVISNRSSNQPDRGEPRLLPVVLDMYRDRYRPARDQRRSD